MPSRSLLLIAILILAVTVPFLIRDSSPNSSDPSTDASTETKLTGFWKRLVGGGSSSESASSAATLEEAEALLAKNKQMLAGHPINVLELAGLPGVSLADALRFDVTPAWVAATWPRLTPQRMETGWYGLRVPLVTGTAPEDVAGSLSYYFNAQNYVERVTLYGYTGDAEPLISLLQQQYGLRPYAAVGRGLFLSFYETVPIGVLEVEDVAVQKSDGQRGRYRVQLELNLPRQGAMLSEEVMQKLRRLHDAKLL